VSVQSCTIIVIDELDKKTFPQVSLHHCNTRSIQLEKHMDGVFYFVHIQHLLRERVPYFH